MPSAIIQEVGGGTIAHTVMRGPGTAQVGEEHAMNSMIQAGWEADPRQADPEHATWAVGDSQAATATRRPYAGHQKANCMMSGISSQIHDAPNVLDNPVNIVITPSHRVTGANRAADN